MSESGKKRMNGCLIGCLSIIGLIIILIITISVVWVVKGDDIVKVFLDQTKAGLEYMLTEDHSEAEKTLFLQSIDSIIESVAKVGLKQTVRLYNDSIVTLQEAMSDQRITRHESTQWQAKFRANQLRAAGNKNLEFLK